MRHPTFFIMIDGLRPDAIGAANMRNVQALIARAASTLTAQSVMPSVTLPCHTSIFHSVPPTRHGITSNIFQPMARPLPGLIDIAHQQGLKAMCIYNWEPLRDLNRPETLWLSFYVNTSYQFDGDDVVAAEAARLIPLHKPDFAFVYFGTVDTAGHSFGWMSQGYLQQATRVDAQLQIVLDTLPADANIILQADHGGHDRGHGTELPEDMTIPWLACGPGVKRGYRIQSPVSLLDTAPTLAQMLEIPKHAHWEGRVVEEIFAY